MIQVSEGASVAVGGNVNEKFNYKNQNGEPTSGNSGCAVLTSNGGTAIVEGKITGYIENNGRGTVCAGELSDAGQAKNISGFLVGAEDETKDITEYFTSSQSAEGRKNALSGEETASGRSYLAADTIADPTTATVVLTTDNALVKNLTAKGSSPDAQPNCTVEKMGEGEYTVTYDGTGGMNRLEFQLKVDADETFDAENVPGEHTVKVKVCGDTYTFSMLI